MFYTRQSFMYVSRVSRINRPSIPDIWVSSMIAGVFLRSRRNFMMTCRVLGIIYGSVNRLEMVCSIAVVF